MGCPKSAGTQIGATLIEVLVAALVGSIGLLGTAGLMTMTAKANHSAYENAQAGVAAQSLIDAMHINPAAVAADSYDGSFDAADAAAADCAKQACTPTQRASYDRARFSRVIATTLPNAIAHLKCEAGGAAAETTCRLQVDWSPQALASNDKQAVAVAGLDIRAMICDRLSEWCNAHGCVPFVATRTGFSLIELMIAMLLGLMLSEGIYVLLSTSSRANATQLALARLQDSGRVALETIASDLRSAGHMPCGAQLQSQVFSDALATHVIGAPTSAAPPAWRDRWPTIPAGPRAVPFRQ